MCLIGVVLGAESKRIKGCINDKCSVLLGFWSEVSLQKSTIQNRRAPDGASASGGQGSSFKRPLVFQVPGRWRCFVLTSAHIFKKYLLSLSDSETRAPVSPRGEEVLASLCCR